MADELNTIRTTELQKLEGDKYSLHFFIVEIIVETPSHTETIFADIFCAEESNSL